MTARKPWDRPNAHAHMIRTCKECRSQRPSMQPLTLFKKDGTRQRGFWHLRCFEIARKKERDK